MNTTMNVGKLKKLIEKLPDNTPVVTPYGEHGYRLLDGASEISALFDKSEYMFTDGEELTPEKEYGKRITVLLID